MRSRLLILLLLSVVGWGCGADPAATPVSSLTTPLEGGAVTTLTTTGDAGASVPTTRGATSPPPTAPLASTTSAVTTTSASAGSTTMRDLGPVYLTFGSLGVFRVEEEAAVRVADDPVVWAASDGMGGVLLVTDPGILRHLPAGAPVATTVGSDLSPAVLGWVEGKPTLVMFQMNQSCGRWDVVLWEVASGTRRVFASCIPFEATGIIPRSMGGGLVLSIEVSGWVEEVPRMRLVFRDLSGEAIVVDHNPWPELCRTCQIDALLSPDGTVLAVAENLPAPEDLGVSDWDEFEALDPTEQWSRWEWSYLPSSTVRLRTVSLSEGDTLWSTEMGVGSLLDFDGRYLVYRFGGMGHHGQFPNNTHLFDTWADQELRIVWGSGDWSAHEQQDVDLIPSGSG